MSLDAAEPGERPAGPRERRLVFGEVAETYDRARPGYPPQLFDAICDFARLEGSRPARLCEVGAGTGKASVLLARRAAVAGWSLTCVEPDPAMARICSRHLGEIARLAFEVQVNSFESFVDEVADPASYELVYAAQSWHWVAPERRAADVARLLAPGGTVALIWNVARPHPPGLRTDVDAAYEAVGAGDVAGTGGAVPARQPLSAVLSADARWRAREELEQSGRFGPVSVASRPWTARYDTASWLELLETHSDHRLLAPEVRRELLERIGAIIDGRGGEIEVDYDAVALLAHRGEEP